MNDLRTLMQDIYDTHKRLTPELVLTEARKPDHPLHSRFEWDDSVAAERWRLEQAHRLITSLRVVYKPATDTEPERDVRAWHAVRAEDADQFTYEPAERVALDPFARRLVLRDMQRDWTTLKRRYESFDEFWKLIAGEAEAANG
jgi:hypothetical protein